MSILFELRDITKSKLSDKQRENIRVLRNSKKLRGIQHRIFRALFGDNLKALAMLYGTDKWGAHRYAQHYEAHFSSLRRKKLNLLEIGIGGYDDPKIGGGSLRMWRTYFPRACVFGIDIYDKSANDERRIKTFQGSQVDNSFLKSVVDRIGRINIVIDDGSHRNDHVIHTFKFLFPHVSQNGIYVIEDTQTSYWPSLGGSVDDLNTPDTSMGFLKQLTDGINYCEFKGPDYTPSYLDQHIVAIHFYHNIVFIKKGLNNEGSNVQQSMG